MRQDVLEHNASIHYAEAARRHHEVPLTYCQDLAAHQARRAWPSKKTDYGHDVEDVGAQNGNHCHDHNQDGKEHHNVGDTHDDHVDRTAIVARQRPQEYCDQDRD